MYVQENCKWRLLFSQIKDKSHQFPSELVFQITNIQFCAFPTMLNIEVSGVFPQRLPKQ